MIGRLSGRLVEKQPPRLLLDVGGVGYEVDVPMTCFYELPQLGEPLTLHIHMVVREDAQLLYGFLQLGERDLFRELIKVSGIGPRIALAILSGMDANGFRACVATGELGALTRVPGIGKKTAERLVIELRDRLGGDAGLAAMSGSRRPATGASPGDEALSALIALGYKPPEAARLLQGVQGEGLGPEELIRQALKAAAR